MIYHTQCAAQSVLDYIRMGATPGIRISRFQSLLYGKPGRRLSQISFPEAWQLSASSNWATQKTGPTFNIKPSLSPTCKGNSWRMWAQAGQEDTLATHLFCPKTNFCSLLGRIWGRLNHDGGEGGGGAAGERAGEGSGEGGVPHRLLLLVVLETRLDLASGPLLHLRVSVWIWKKRIEVELSSRESVLKEECAVLQAMGVLCLDPFAMR